MEEVRRHGFDRGGVRFVLVQVFFHLEMASMCGHLHDFVTASTDEMTAMVVSNLGTSAEQPTAMTALATCGTDPRLVGSYGTTADGL